MSEIEFDTLTAVRRLKEVQFTDEQAETITRTVRDGVIGGVATKADIHEVQGEITKVKAEVKIEIAEVRAEIAEVRAEITKVKAEVKAEIAEVRAEVARLETRMTIKFGEIQAEIGEFKTEVKRDLKWMRVLGAGILAALSALGWATYELHGLVAALAPG